MQLRSFFISSVIVFFASQNLLLAHDNINIAAEAKESKAEQIKANEQETDNFYVKQLNRYSDLDKNDYYFKVILDNNQSFEVQASLNDLLEFKISEGMPFQRISEEFVTDEPWLSTFTYASVDGSIILENKFDSLNSHWHPAPSQEIIELTDKDLYRLASGVSNFAYILHFSDGSDCRVSYERYKSGVFNVGDQFYKIQSNSGDVPSVLVKIADGRVITKSDQNKFIKITW